MTMSHPSNSNPLLVGRSGRKDRRRRFQPSGDVTVQLTPDDVVLFRLVRQHRLITSRQLFAALGGERNPRAFTHRLAVLFHSGFLDRPRMQVRPGEPGRPYVYALGAKGWDMLERADGVTPTGRRDRGAENRRLKPMTIDHEVAVAETILAFHLAALGRGWSFTWSTGDVFRRQTGLPRRVRITSRDDVQGTLPINPDGFLSLTDDTGKSRRFFLEIDLGTEPQVRRTLRVSSVMQKLYAYWEVFCWKRRIVQNALFVTTTQTRLENMIDVARAIDPKGVGSAFFHFALLENCNVDQPERVLFDDIWRSARVGYDNRRPLIIPSCRNCGRFLDPANEPHIILNAVTALSLAPASTLLPDLAPDELPIYAHPACHQRTKQLNQEEPWPAT
jgi:hypothetical protein